MALSAEEYGATEGDLSDDECGKALKDVKQGKSPGTDSLPDEFYRVFWADVSEPLIEALNYGFGPTLHIPKARHN